MKHQISKKSILSPLLAGIAAVASLTSLTGHADTVAFTPVVGPGTATQAADGYSIGYVFTLTAPVSIDSLGYYDSGSDGLGTSHDVGIWQFSGLSTTAAPLVTGTVASGTVDPLTASFRYDAITPVSLAAGTYVIAGTTSSADAWLIQATSVISSAPTVTYGGIGTISGTPFFLTSAFAPGAGLNYPIKYYPYPTIENGSTDSNAYFGPNFAFTTVPEPSTYALTGVSLLAGLFFLRRRLARS